MPRGPWPAFRVLGTPGASALLRVVRSGKSRARKSAAHDDFSAVFDGDVSHTRGITEFTEPPRKRCSPPRVLPSKGKGSGWECETPLPPTPSFSSRCCDNRSASSNPSVARSRPIVKQSWRRNRNPRTLESEAGRSTTPPISEDELDLADGDTEIDLWDSPGSSSTLRASRASKAQERLTQRVIGMTHRRTQLQESRRTQLQGGVCNLAQSCWEYVAKSRRKEERLASEIAWRRAEKRAQERNAVEAEALEPERENLGVKASRRLGRLREGASAKAIRPGSPKGTPPASPKGMTPGSAKEARPGSPTGMRPGSPTGCRSNTPFLKLQRVAQDIKEASDSVNSAMLQEETARSTNPTLITSRAANRNAASPRNAATTAQHARAIPYENWTGFDTQKMAMEFNLPASTIGMIKRMFDRYDTSGDGTLDREEFLLMVRSLLKDQYPTVREIPKDLFEGVDKSKDGKLDFTEFLQWFSMNAFSEKFLLSTAQQHIRYMARKFKVSIDNVEDIKRQFDKFDCDGSGEIDIGEFRKLLNILLKVPAHVDLPEKRVSSFWNEIDADGSGVVDFEEFFGWYRRYFAGADSGKLGLSPIEKFYASVRVVPGSRTIGSRPKAAEYSGHGSGHGSYHGSTGFGKY